jgi:SAM-dependent methyltransferase
MKLNIGAGYQKNDGYTGVDIRPISDIQLDIEKEVWPWADDSIEEIVSEHVVEHIHSLPDFLNNCHRVLKPGGQLLILTPHPLCEFFWGDPTHIRGYTPNTFLVYATGIHTTEHAGIIPWSNVEAWTSEQIINNVQAVLIRVVMTK